MDEKEREDGKDFSRDDWIFAEQNERTNGTYNLTEISKYQNIKISKSIQLNLPNQ